MGHQTFSLGFTGVAPRELDELASRIWAKVVDFLVAKLPAHRQYVWAAADQVDRRHSAGSPAIPGATTAITFDVRDDHATAALVHWLPFALAKISPEVGPVARHYGLAPARGTHREVAQAARAEVAEFLATRPATLIFAHAKQLYATDALEHGIHHLDDARYIPADQIAPELLAAAQAAQASSGCPCPVCAPLLRARTKPRAKPPASKLTSDDEPAVAALLARVAADPDDHRPKEELADLLVARKHPRGAFLSLFLRPARSWDGLPSVIELGLDGVRIVNRARPELRAALGALRGLVEVVTYRAGFPDAVRFTRGPAKILPFVDDPFWATVRAIEARTPDEAVPFELIASPLARSLERVGSITLATLLRLLAGDRTHRLRELAITTLEAPEPATTHAPGGTGLGALEVLEARRFEPATLAWVLRAHLPGLRELRLHVGARALDDPALYLALAARVPTVTLVGAAASFDRLVLAGDRGQLTLRAFARHRTDTDLAAFTAVLLAFAVAGVPRITLVDVPAIREVSVAIASVRASLAAALSARGLPTELVLESPPG